MSDFEFGVQCALVAALAFIALVVIYVNSTPTRRRP
jgi:hypothetical protein